MSLAHSAIPFTQQFTSSQPTPTQACGKAAARPPISLNKSALLSPTGRRSDPLGRPFLSSRADPQSGWPMSSALPVTRTPVGAVRANLVSRNRSPFARGTLSSFRLVTNGDRCHPAVVCHSLAAGTIRIHPVDLRVVATYATKVICRPSGDQVGYRSGPESSVRATVPLPSAFIRRSRSRRRAYWGVLLGGAARLLHAAADRLTTECFSPDQIGLAKVGTIGQPIASKGHDPQ